MDFENMVGTTGVATYMNKLYVVNNKSIRVFDQYGRHTDIPQPYDRVSGITIGGDTLYGIYHDTTNGLFEMNVKTQTFRSVPVEFNPVSIFYLDDSTAGIIIMDDVYRYYRCDKHLTVHLTGEVLPSDLIPTKFMTFGMTKSEYTSYFSTNEKIIDMRTLKPLTITVPGNILSIQYYLNFLFVIYVSDYNQYSVLQYDTNENKVIKTIEGGYISGPPLYSCIYQNYIIVSASTNNLIPLTKFDIPLLNDSAVTSDLTNSYPLFDLPEITDQYIEQVDIPVDQLKSLKDTLEVDTRPAEKNLGLSYLWMFACIAVISIFLLMFLFKEDPNLPKWGLGLFVLLVILFITQYI